MEKISWRIPTAAAALVLVIIVALPLHAAPLSAIEQAHLGLQGGSDIACRQHLVASTAAARVRLARRWM